MATFAVVGHPNKGKSSIVATLAENERIAISPTPGTTQQATQFTFSVDEQPLYHLVDTPGFQRAAAVLDWLNEHASDASDRADTVRSFVDGHADDPRFHDECELLRPILAGAGILYVVDGTKPYGAEYEVEMQILQWTGQPRMALINLIGDGDYVDEWRRGLGQYFSIVRVFDAMRADFTARVQLLQAFAELDEAWRGEMQTAIAALEQERMHRLQRSAAEIAAALLDCLSYTAQAPLGDDADANAVGERLREDLLQKIRDREQRVRDAVQGLYRHEALERQEAGLRLLDVDLFTREGWELFGLSKTQLMITGSLTGAVAGLGIDALVGGATLLLGAGIGAVLGGVGSWLASDEIAKTEVLGSTLGGQLLRVGPVRAANFPWVFIGRAWVHHHMVAERNHALRDALSSRLEAGQNLMDGVPDDVRQQLARCLSKIQKSGRSLAAEGELGAHLLALLQTPLSVDVGA